uniref:Uncharacterized protein n=1 Tax=Heterosigma akashiwo TaxID=2829 RepID=A0A7S3Y6C9_HETAK
MTIIISVVSLYFSTLLPLHLVRHRRIPVVNLFGMAFWGESKSFEQMSAQQDFYGLLFALLLMVPLSFLGAVEYEELEDAIDRLEEGGVYECLTGILVGATRDFVGSLSLTFSLATFFLMAGLLVVVFLEVMLKAAEQSAREMHREDEMQIMRAAQIFWSWMRFASALQLGFLIIGIDMSVLLIATVAAIKFPDSMVENACASGESEYWPGFTIASPIAFVFESKEAIVTGSVIAMLIFSSGLVYEFEKRVIYSSKEKNDGAMVAMVPQTTVGEEEESKQ